MNASTPNATSTQKIARQSNHSRTWPPISGATMGAEAVTSMLSDRIRALWLRA